MTNDELRAIYNVAYKIVAREQRWREVVFPEGNPKRDEKLREMERLLEILVQMKDELKARIDREVSQPRLLDVPRRTEYG